MSYKTFVDKEYYTLELPEGIVTVTKLKPEIERVMYYDDTEEAPSKKLEGFIRYNLSQLPKDLLAGHAYFLHTYHTDENIAYMSIGRDMRVPNQRFLTNDEIKAYNKVLAQAREDFTKRLTTYYKRYADKIITVGYWANR